MSPADYLRIVRRRWWVLVLIPVLFAGLTYELLSNRATTYTATTTILVSQGSLLQPSAGGDIEDANALAQVYGTLVTSPAVIQAVDDQLSLSGGSVDDSASIGAEPDPVLPILTIWAESSDPRLAAQIANATADALIAWLSAQDVELTGESTESLQVRIDEVWNSIQTTSQELATLRNQGSTDPASEAAVSGLESLLQQYWVTYESLLELQQRLEIETIGAQNRLTVIAAAEVPDASNQRSPVLFAIAAGVLGFGVAAMVIAALELLDRRVRSGADVQRAVPLPVLASVPRFRRLPVGRSPLLPTMAAPESGTADAYRLLRTRCLMTVNGHGLGIIAVASSEFGEGAPDVAANLAVAFAESGLRVVLVDADLRSPSLDRAFQYPESTQGLATLIANPAVPAEAVLVPGPHQRIRLLLATRTEPAISRIGDAGRLREVLTNLKATSDVVVVIAPPILAVSDGLVVAGAATSILLVARAGKTRPTELQAAAGNLDAMQLNVQGVVLRGVDRHAFGG